MLEESIIQALPEIWSHALEFPDQECCGIIFKEEVNRAINIADDPNDFELDAETSNRVWSLIKEGNRPIIYHSHLTNEDWSHADIIKSRELNLPYLMVCLKTGTYKFYDPDPDRPLINREFHWLANSCYDVVRDYYWQVHQIRLDAFYLDHPKGYEEPRWNLYLDNLPSQGFVQLDTNEPLKKSDLILMQMGCDRPNHVGVMYDPEANKMLHHCIGHLSKLAPYGSDYREATHSIWRHKSLWKS